MPKILESHKLCVNVKKACPSALLARFRRPVFHRLAMEEVRNKNSRSAAKTKTFPLPGTKYI